MSSEVVIDTNVLVHAQKPNANKIYGQKSRDFLDEIKTKIDSSTPIYLCVDNNYSKPGKNTNESKISWEYQEHIRVPGSYSFIFLKIMATNRLIRSKDRFRNQREKDVIRQCISNKKKMLDCTFVGVACSADSKTLASNDFEDFKSPVRINIHRRLDVNIFSTPDQRLKNIFR